MPKIIVKCGYLKGASHRSFYAKYMATREGTEKISHSYGQAEATAKQKDMILESFLNMKTILKIPQVKMPVKLFLL